MGFFDNTVLSVLLVGLVLSAQVQAYFWHMVYSSDDYLPETVMHTSTDEGLQSSCRVDLSGRAGRDKTPHTPKHLCQVPYGGDELDYNMPYEVLVRDPNLEAMVWTYTPSASDIRANGVNVCSGCSASFEYYVCAVPNWGPGKLRLWNDDTIQCYVGYGGREHEFYDGYQALLALPAYEYRLTEVNYFLDDLAVMQDNPLTMAGATFINNDNNDHVVVQTLTYSKTSTSEWQNTLGFAIGAAMSVSAGIPLFVEVEWEIGAELTYEYSFGSSYSETIEISLEAQVTVPAKHSCYVSIVARQMLADVPYDATATIYYPDDTTSTEYISGVYEGLSVSQDSVQIDECLPLE